MSFGAYYIDPHTDEQWGGLTEMMAVIFGAVVFLPLGTLLGFIGLFNLRSKIGWALLGFALNGAVITLWLLAYLSHRS